MFRPDISFTRDSDKYQITCFIFRYFVVLWTYAVPFNFVLKLNLSFLSVVVPRAVRGSPVSLKPEKQPEYGMVATAGTSDTVLYFP